MFGHNVIPNEAFSVILISDRVPMFRVISLTATLKCLPAQKFLTMSEKVYARVLFDRRKELAKRGKGKVDIIITLSRKEIKYVTVTHCTALEWRDYKTSPELLMRVAMYNDIAKQMANLGE